MTPTKDFDRLPEQDLTPSCEFRLGGRVWHCKNGSRIPWVLVEPAMIGEIKTQVGAFFEMVIVPDEKDEFLAMISDPGSDALTASNALPLMQWITEQVMKRPTKRPASSRGGPRTTARKSGGNSSSRDTPKQR